MQPPATISILGCGWLGRPLGCHLAARAYQVKGSTTTREKLEQLESEDIQPYLLTLDPSLEGASDFFECDALVLNIPPPRGVDDRQAYHLRQVDAVREAAAAAECPWILFASSTGVYPKVPGVVTESDVPDDPESVEAPMRSTGRLLIAAERRLQNDARFDTTVIRFAGLYGGERKPARFLAGRTDVSGPEAPINLIHRDDCIGIVEAILEQEATGEVFNACADEHPTRRTFYTHEAQRLGLEPPTFADDGATNKVVSNARVKRVLGYSFRHPSPMGDPARE